MLTLYKYTKKEFAQKIVDEGSLYISALKDFHDTIKLNSAIGDIREGKVKFDVKGQLFDTGDPHHNKSLAYHLSQSFVASRLMIQAEEINIHTKNVFIFSTSQILDKKLADEFGYDICIKIEPYEDFYKELTDSLIGAGYKIKETLTKDCLYINRRYRLKDELPDAPVFLKEEKYSKQKEVRSVWVMPDVEEKSFVFKCPTIRKFCSIVAF